MLLNPDDPLAIFDTLFYNINKKLLTIVGLWPELDRKRKVFMLAIFTILILSLSIPIFAGMWHYYHLGKIMYVVENIVGLLYLTITCSKYITYSVLEERIKELFYQINEDWKNVTDEEELKIIRSYSNMSRFLTAFYLCYASAAAFLFNIVPFLPLAMDIVIPLGNNKSRIRLQSYHPYYFDLIDAEKYYNHLYLLHGNCVVYTSTLAAVAIDTMTAANVQHACALFTIVSHRLRKIGTVPVDEASKVKIKIIDNKTITEQIRHVCAMHRASNKLNCPQSVLLLQRLFGMNWLLFLGGSLLGITLLMFDLIFNLEHPLERMIGFLFMFGIEILLFYVNWIAQRLTDSSEGIFIASSESCWYNLTVDGQKLMYFMFQKNINAVYLKAGGIANLNLQQFLAVTKTSMSYATVMLQINE